jgi:hypothetical protein
MTIFVGLTATRKAVTLGSTPLAVAANFVEAGQSTRTKESRTISALVVLIYNINDVLLVFKLFCTHWTCMKRNQFGIDSHIFDPNLGYCRKKENATAQVHTYDENGNLQMVGNILSASNRKDLFRGMEQFRMKLFAFSAAAF